MAFQRDENEIGVLWEKSGRNGTYFTGSVEIDGQKQPIVVFKNGNKKEGSKAPDWRILKPQKRERDESLTNEVGFPEYPDPPF